MLILFSCNIMSAKKGEIWKKTELSLICFVLEMTADSNKLRDFFKCMCLIKVAWKN